MELLVAVVVLGIIAAPILGCIAFMRQSLAESKLQAQVQALLRDKIAQTAASGKTVSLTLSNVTGSAQRLLGGTDVVVTTSVTKVGSYSNLYSIKATATWTATQTHGRSESEALETYVISPQT